MIFLITSHGVLLLENYPLEGNKRLFFHVSVTRQVIQSNMYFTNEAINVDRKVFVKL
jgi:hypothetical protein